MTLPDNSGSAAGHCQSLRAVIGPALYAFSPLNVWDIALNRETA